MTTRRPRPIHLLLSALLVLALAPATGLAAEPASTPPAPSSTEPTTTAPPPEAPAQPPAASNEAAPPPPSAGAGTPQVQTTTPQVQTGHSQGATPSAAAPAGSQHKGYGVAPGSGPAPAGAGSSTAGGARATHPAHAPSTLTPSLPLALETSIAGVPSFFIESFRIPPFLLPIFQAAGTAYGIPWQALAAINEVETDYGRDLSVSSAGAEGWMQFLPAEWAQYGVDANGDGVKDPYNPADAIFAAARYLRAAGGDGNIREAVYSYNHSQAYVSSVMLRAQLLGGTPSELLGAITGLTEARFPVHAAAHFSDGFPALAASGSPANTVPATTIYTQAGAPVIAVQDGEVVKLGHSPSLGRFVSLRDAFGNTYTYAELGDLASLYPVLVPHVHSGVSKRIDGSGGSSEPMPSGPATAGAQPRSPVSEGATVSGLALGAAAALEPAPQAPQPPASPAASPPAPHPAVRVFREGPNDVYLHPLRAGVQVIAGTVLGHVGSSAAANTTASAGEPHIIFQIRPAGAGAPLIDPKPILDGWVALENTSIFRAKGENPFLATSPTVGQVLLESKQQLEPQVLHDAGVRLGACGRQAIQGGTVDKRVLAMLEYLSVSGLKPTVSGLKCAGSSLAASAAKLATNAGTTLKITAVNGIPVAGHQRAGSLADTTVRKLLMLQGANRPRQIASLMSYPGALGALTEPSARDAIAVSFGSGRAQAAGASGSVLSPREWSKLVARLGEIPDPTVARAPSPAAIPDKPAAGAGTGSEPGGNR
jgi:murein DD-endopeptidase MepM/ murein hydrolase activator NlpD